MKFRATKKGRIMQNFWIRLKKNIPHFISFLLPLYIAGLLVFGLLRFVLLLLTAGNEIRLADPVTLTSFVIGIKFDSVVLAYIMFIPLVLLFIHHVTRTRKLYIPWLLFFYYSIIFPVFLFITLADIPYFKFFSNRISDVALQWFNTPGIVFKMIYSNNLNLLFLLIGVFLAVLLIYLLYRYFRNGLFSPKVSLVNSKQGRLSTTLLFLLAAVICIQGMRGKKSHPIRIDDAFYSNDPYLNQVGLNPCFTLFKSYITKVKLMEADKAILATREILKISNPLNSISPIARKTTSFGENKKYNVVIILMEGMSSAYMSYFGNKDKLTPVLDSLATVSWFFKNAYSAGIHTNNGVFSTLYSFPALKRIRPMKSIPFNTYSGLPYTLKQLGYSTLFFTTQDKQFDNLSNFLDSNFIDKLYSQENYPPDKILGPYGVPDDYLFSFAVDELSKLEDGKPFFATILTSSNHDPYIIPDYYKGRFDSKETNALIYSDWSIGKFLQLIRKTKWFQNTIFVFVADHGFKIGKSPFDINLAQNHIPIMFYSPSIFTTPTIFDHFIGQIDIFPTLMGILNASYINNTLGVDVFKEKRECIYFSADDKLACINDDWLFIYRYDGGREGLYNYKKGLNIDLSNENKKVKDFMKKYAFSQTQTADWIITNDKTKIK